MTDNQPEFLQDVQRVSVALEGHAAAKRVKIALESFDSGLGWYAAGSVSIPLHQLPFLEQALEELRRAEDHRSEPSGTIIPFPGLRSSAAVLGTSLAATTQP